jgi:hypothetical protein
MAQVTVAPVALLPVLELESEEEVLVLGAVEDEPASVDFLDSPPLSGLESLLLDVFFASPLPSSFLPGFAELYRSAYQPLPFKMKPAPPDTWRLAVSRWQLGQVVSGAALMRCSSSQACWQAVHTYS